MIEVRDLEKRYEKFTAVKDVSFTIEKGDIVGLLGPNGAGKTTIMKILTAYHYPTGGSATIEGYDVVQEPEKVKEILGYLPENAPVYPELTVREYLDFIAGSRLGKGKTASGLTARDAIEKSLESCGLTEVYKKSIDTLSKGYRQRVGLAQAILHDPGFLILDEPTTGLDPNQILEIRKLIKDLGKEKTIILSTHILQEVEAVCSRVLILNKGKIIAQGKTEEIGRELRGEVLCKVSLRGAADGFFKKLGAAFPDYRKNALEKAFPSAEYSAFEIAFPGNTEKTALDFQEILFSAALDSGVRLLELSPTSTSLEDIFISLTSQSDPEPATEEAAASREEGTSNE